jgi:putative tryptophan/tyrosine transport system substrate-binding protein
MKVTAIPQDARGCRMASSHAADGRPPFGPCRQGTTSSIPIVFNAGEDPVTLSLVSSINLPGGNATGVYGFLVEVDAKRMELLRELVPNPALIAVLLNPNQTRFKTVSEEIAAQLAAA